MDTRQKMKYIRQKIKNEIENELSSALEKLGTSSEEIRLEVPRESERGDFASTIAMQLTKKLRRNPREIAAEIVDNFNQEKIPQISEIEIAGPGFINFKLDENWNNSVIDEVLAYKEDYGRSEEHKGQSYNVEYVSANPTGPMHIGNARGGAIGDVIASVADWTGYEVTREFYVNDAGNQIKKLGDSLEARFWELMGEDYPFPEDGYHGEDVKEAVKLYLKELDDSQLEDLKSLESEKRKKILSASTVARNLEAMKRDLSIYGVNYDTWFSEKSLYEDESIDKALEKLKESGHTYTKDGAVWFKSTDFGLEKDDVLVRENKIPTYFLGDIAYHINKFDQRGFDRGINIWGADHHGHVARLKAALEAVGIKDRLEVVLMQLVKLIRNDERVRLSKREGHAYGLTELTDEIGVDAARYFFNMRSPDSHFEFDLDLAVEESNENPVFYVQYAHARISSLLSKIGETDFHDADYRLLKEPEERELINTLTFFPEEIKATVETLDPSRMTHYAYQLASAFHSFYNAHRVNVEDENLRRARAALVAATKQVLKNVLDILGVSAPESM